MSTPSQFASSNIVSNSYFGGLSNERRVNPLLVRVDAP
jgi:hypothetical protein